MKNSEDMIMKKIIALALCLLTCVACLCMTGCSNDKIIVQTNAYFAPFEYYDGAKIVGVDVEIMNLVGEKLNREIEFQNVEFSVIIEKHGEFHPVMIHPVSGGIKAELKKLVYRG
jgi:ABC-type amino acid transport substrate-binding protein